MPVDQSRTLRVIDLGFAPYEATLKLQQAVREERLAGHAADTLLLVEHPPTITLGRRASTNDLLAPLDFFQAQGTQVVPVERGGKATYHGPGQLISYPIISLRGSQVDVPAYVYGLEQIMLDYLAQLGIQAQRRRGLPGAWVWGRKIGAVGVHLKRWVSLHGFALNLNPDLFQFSNIIPCGLPDAETTSVQRELGRAPWVLDAKAAIAPLVAKQFGFTTILHEPPAAVQLLRG